MPPTSVAHPLETTIDARGRAGHGGRGAAAPAWVGPVGGHGWGPAPIDLVTAVLVLAVSVGVVVLLMTPPTSRDFRSGRQPPAGTNGR
jgi:hypothetical protein